MRWLLTLFMRRADRRQLESDLSDLHDVRRERDGDDAADRWLRQQRRASVLHAIGAHVRDGAAAFASWMPQSRRDLTQSIRSLARTPGTTATVILSIGLGLGAITAMLAVIDGVLRAPLPYQDADRLYWIYTDNPPFRFRFSVVDYRALAADHPGFDAVAGYQTNQVTVDANGSPERVTVKSVTGSYFPMLGQHAEVGRLFDASDDAGKDPIVVLTSAYWQQHYGGDLSVVGRAMVINGVSHTIVGVLQRHVGPLERTVAAFTAQRWPDPRRKGPFGTMALGRLRGDMPVDAARDTLKATNTRLFPLWQTSYQDEGATWGLQDLKTRVVGDVGRPLWFILIGLGCVLLVATANAMHLLVGRALDRRREWTIRRALGAAGLRLFQPLIVEGGLLAAACALAAVGVAVGLVRLLRAFGGPYIPRVEEVVISPAVWATLGTLTLIVAVLLLAGGLLPAVRTVGNPLERDLRSGTRSVTDGPLARRLRRALVATEFALAMPLLVAAVMVTLSLLRLAQVPVGIDSDRLLTAGVTLVGPRYAEEAARADFWERVLDRMRGLPGVDAAALADSRPPAGANNTNNFNLEDRPTPPGENQPLSTWVSASPDYFATVGLRLERGRLLDERSLDNNEIVVDRAWANRFFPSQEIVGRRLRNGGCTDCPWTTVVGMVGTVKWQGLESSDDGTVYYPFADFPTGYVILRTGLQPSALITDLRRTIKEMDPHLAIVDLATGTELIAESLETPRYLTILAAGFALVAFVLAGAGIYAVMSHFVRQHRGDIGIRLALGGRPSDVRRLVLGQGLRVVGLGLSVGAISATLVARTMSAQLFGTQGTEAIVIVSVGVSLALVATVVCLAPGRRAARFDPAIILREL